MVTKRILIFGGSSQLGKALQKQSLPGDWLLHAPTRAACDFMQPQTIARTIRDFAPDLVINAAAMTDIDACEQDPDTALAINFDAVANLASHCVEHNTPLIQISTDYVFDGNDNITYKPDDAMNPVNNYGHSKMMGEEAARHASYGHIIIRTSLLFSAFGDNILTRTLRQIDAGETVTAVTDQFQNPTSATSLARALITIADKILDGFVGGFGTFHFCNEPPLSRAAFAQAIIDAYAPGTPLNGVTAASIPNRVPRPLHTPLDGAKLHTIYGIAPQPWHDELTAAIRHYKTQPTSA